MNKPASATQTSSTRQARKFEEVYRVGDVLGKGGFGTVYSGVRVADNLPVAIKHVAKNKVTEWTCINGHRVPLELKLLQRVQSVQGVVRLYDFIEKRDSFIYVLERPGRGKDLFDFITDKSFLSEDLSRELFRDIVQTVMECHEHGVTHRDIKDENIVIDLDTGRLSLIDFGSGAFTKDDIFTDFDMVIGDIPYERDEDICRAELNYRREVSSNCRSLIQSCLTVDQSQRISLENILHHPWMLEEPDQSSSHSSVNVDTLKQLKLSNSSLESL